MATSRIDRRELLRKAIYGGVGGAVALEQLGGVPLLGTWASKHVFSPVMGTRDAFYLMRDALAGGPSALAVAEAFATTDDQKWVIVDIKVMTQVHHPMIFKLGDAAGPKASANLNASANVKAQGVDLISDNARWAKLRFNKWFAGCLGAGTSDGAAPTAANLRGLEATDVCDLNGPAIGDKVAVQTFMGLAQPELIVHQLRGCRLRKTQGDIGFLLDQTRLLYSPLGITCFMMGNEYDSAGPPIARNAVLGTGDGGAVIVASRTVTDYVDQIKQFTSGRGFADHKPIEQNVVYRMDKLVNKDPVLRSELINSITGFGGALGALRAAADLEARRETAVKPEDGAAQSTLVGDAATIAAGLPPSSEFVAQCKYVAQSMHLPNTPLRNFSLFLNVIDLDGKNLDAPVNTADASNKDLRAYTYVEGMRQLAMGLNVIAKEIADGKNIIVYVHSEGGRSATMGDSIVSFALVMGPKGTGMLDDELYASNEMVGGTIMDTGIAGAAKAWGTPDSDIYGLNNSKIDGVVPSAGDVGMGIVEFIEEKMGKAKGGRTGMSDDDARYVKLKRG